MRLTCFFMTALVLAALIFTPGNSSCQQDFPFQGEVNSDKINLRADSTVSSETITVLRRGARVEVVLELYDWYKVRLPRSAPSFVKQNLAECIKFGVEAPLGCKKAAVLKENVNVRLRPSESSPVLGKVQKNEEINILKAAQGWYKIEPVANTYGWVHKRFVSRAAPKEEVKIVEAVKMPAIEPAAEPVKGPEPVRQPARKKTFGCAYWR